MAKTQSEDGYTQIANEILEHLVMMHLSSNQWQVLLFIIRKTYGFHKKVDYIANFQIGQATGLGKTVVSRVLHNLQDMNVITRRGKVMGIQNDWEKWQGLTFQTTLDVKLAGELTSGSTEKLAEQSTELAGELTELAEQSTKVSSPDVTQKKKETITKETIQKKEAPKKKRYFFDNILLTQDEYDKLVEKFGEEGTRDRLEALSLYKKSRGKKYASDYATILSWDRKDARDRGGQSNGANRGHSRSRRLPSTYRSPEEIYGDNHG